jgi:DNA-binding response OmpR family regulator
VKPFSARELLARVEAILRRSAPAPKSDPHQLKWGRATIDLARRELFWSKNDRVEISEMESLLLRYLVNHRERAVSREELLSRVWGIESAGLETRTVDMHVARLRAKLRDPHIKTDEEAILTVRSQGYMIHENLLPSLESAL